MDKHAFFLTVRSLLLLGACVGCVLGAPRASGPGLYTFSVGSGGESVAFDARVVLATADGVAAALARIPVAGVVADAQTACANVTRGSSDVVLCGLEPVTAYSGGLVVHASNSSADVRVCDGRGCVTGAYGERADGVCRCASELVRLEWTVAAAALFAGAGSPGTPVSVAAALLHAHEEGSLPPGASDTVPPLIVVIAPGTGFIQTFHDLLLVPVSPGEDGAEPVRLEPLLGTVTASASPFRTRDGACGGRWFPPVRGLGRGSFTVPCALGGDLESEFAVPVAGAAEYVGAVLVSSDGGPEATVTADSSVRVYAVPWVLSPVGVAVVVWAHLVLAVCAALTLAPGLWDDIHPRVARWVFPVTAFTEAVCGVVGAAAAWPGPGLTGLPFLAEAGVGLLALACTLPATARRDPRLFWVGVFVLVDAQSFRVLSAASVAFSPLTVAAEALFVGAAVSAARAFVPRPWSVAYTAAVAARVGLAAAAAACVGYGTAAGAGTALARRGGLVLLNLVWALAARVYARPTGSAASV